MLNGVDAFWVMLTSILDYISFVWVDHIFVIGYYTFTPLIFKWINLNHLTSLCDCPSLSLPITVKQVSVSIHWVFSTSRVYIIIQEWSWFFWRGTKILWVCALQPHTIIFCTIWIVYQITEPLNRFGFLPPFCHYMIYHMLLLTQLTGLLKFLFF